MPELRCKICSNQFYVKPSHIKLGYGKYCSTICRTRAQLRGKYVLCSICAKSVWKMPKELKHSKSGLFFCSKSCQTKWRNSFFSAHKHPFWINGITVYRNILTRTGKKQVCSRCKLTDTRLLAVHHLDKDRTNNKTGNLVWLCYNCHFLIHHDKLENNAYIKNLNK